MTVKKSFPYGLGCLVLIAAIGALTAYDVKRHGTFKSSSTGLFLRDIGALKYGEQAWNNAVVISGKSYQWAEENVPHYYAIASEKAKPALELCWKGIIITTEYLTIWYENIRVYGEAATRIFVDWVNHYAPGLLEKLRELSIHVWNMTVYYTIAMWNWSLEYVNVALEWLRNTVFTWAEENVSPYCAILSEKTEPVIWLCWEWILVIANCLSLWCNSIRDSGEEVVKIIVNWVTYCGPGLRMLKVVFTFLCNIAASLVLIFCRWSFKFGSLIFNWMRNAVSQCAEENFPHYYSAMAEMAKSIIRLCLKGVIDIADYVVPWSTFIDWMNYYAPGLLERLKVFSTSLLNATLSHL